MTGRQPAVRPDEFVDAYEGTPLVRRVKETGTITDATGPVPMPE